MPNEKLISWQVALYALYLKDGSSKGVHIDDVVLQAYELAKELFCWEKYTEHPAWYLVRQQLDGVMRKKQFCERIGTSDWQLTENGVKWVLANESRLSDLLGQSGTKTKAAGRQNRVHKKLNRIRNHSLYTEFKDNPEFSPTMGKLAGLLRCSIDAERSIWEKRIQSAINEAIEEDMEDVQEFLRRCKETIDSNEGIETL